MLRILTHNGPNSLQYHSSETTQVSAKKGLIHTLVHTLFSYTPNILLIDIHTYHIKQVSFCSTTGRGWPFFGVSCHCTTGKIIQLKNVWTSNSVDHTHSQWDHDWSSMASSERFCVEIVGDIAKFGFLGPHCLVGGGLLDPHPRILRLSTFGHSAKCRLNIECWSLEIADAEDIIKQQSCAIAKMTARCALYK